MEFTVAQIAGIIGGEVEGNPNAVVNTLAKIEEGKEKSLTFLANPAYTEFIYSTQATAAIVSKTFVAEKPITTTLIRVDKPYESFALLLETYNQIKNNKTGIEQPSFVASNAQLGKDVYIGAFAYIGSNVKIGEGTVVLANAVLNSGCSVGINSIVNTSVVVDHDSTVGNHVYLKLGTIITNNCVVEDYCTTELGQIVINTN